jgi:hypothetical protein
MAYLRTRVDMSRSSKVSVVEPMSSLLGTILLGTIRDRSHELCQPLAQLFERQFARLMGRAQ